MNFFKAIVSGAVITFLFIAASCAAGEKSPEPVKPAPRAEPAPETGPAQALSKIVAEAKEERRIVILATLSTDARTAVSKAFQDKFGIEVEFVSASPAELARRMLSERKAGIYTTDIFITGNIIMQTVMKPAGALDPIKPVLILPEVIDPKVWWGGDLRWLDPRDNNILGMWAYPSLPLIINSEMVNPADLKSYKDLLKPEWKGKIIMGDPTVPSAAASWFAGMAFGMPQLGLPYLRELAKQEPLVTRDLRLQVEWIARGKYAIGLAAQQDFVTEFIKTGAPLKWVSPEDGVWLAVGSGYITLLNKPPHPNAAKLFLNWVLTRDTQTLLSKSTGNQSARLDVPTDFLDPFRVRNPDTKYLWLENEEWVRQAAGSSKIAGEIFLGR